MKKLLAASLLLLVASASFGQNCGLVSGTKNKKTGVETKGGVVATQNFYSLMIQRRLNPAQPLDTLSVFLFLHAAAKSPLPDEILQSKGELVLLLSNGASLVVRNAECRNNPLHLGPSIGFTAHTTPKVLEQIAATPIVKITAFGILETEFTPRQQKQQVQIATCLLR